MGVGLHVPLSNFLGSPTLVVENGDADSALIALSSPWSNWVGLAFAVGIDIKPISLG